MLDKLISLFDPNTLLGAIGIGLCALFIATAIAILIRRFTLRVEARMSDVTVLRFISMVAQLSTYLIVLVLYAHLIPPLRAIGTALLAGASVLSVVAGLAAQDTLGNLIAGFSLVMSGAVREGDTIKLYCPVGMITARVHVISLGFTVLVDQESNEVVVPNSVIMNSAIMRIETKTASPAA